MFQLSSFIMKTTRLAREVLWGSSGRLCGGSDPVHQKTADMDTEVHISAV